MSELEQGDLLLWASGLSELSVVSTKTGISGEFLPRMFVSG